MTLNMIRTNSDIGIPWCRGKQDKNPLLTWLNQATIYAVRTREQRIIRYKDVRILICQLK